MKRKENCYDALKIRQLMGRSYLSSLSQMRGFWNKDMEIEVQGTYLPILLAADNVLEKFRGLTFENIRDGMKTVARQREGYMIDRTQPQSTIASSLEACHQLGLLQSQYADGKIWYTFASRLHQRYVPRLRFRFLSKNS